MQRTNGQRTLLAVFITAVAAFALGLAGADSLGWTTPETATVPTESATLPTGSLAEWSRPHPHSADLRPIIDAELNALLAKLDTILTSYAPRTRNYHPPTESALWRFHLAAATGPPGAGAGRARPRLLRRPGGTVPGRNRDGRPLPVHARQPDAGPRRPEHRRQGHRGSAVCAGRLPGQRRRPDLLGRMVWAMPRGVSVSAVHARSLQGRQRGPARREQRRGSRNDQDRQRRRRGLPTGSGGMGTRKIPPADRSQPRGRSPHGRSSTSWTRKA